MKAKQRLISAETAALLNKKAAFYNTPTFIINDPISIPHQFSKLQDIEIAGFFSAIFAWGNRTTIINKCNNLMERMDNAPYDFCIGHKPSDLKKLLSFKHRTFNTDDLLYFISFFKQHYKNYYSLEDAFLLNHHPKNENTEAALNGFYHYFFSFPHAPQRTRKHIAAPEKKASCKRINMFLRWMVRNDKKGVDFGLWRKINPSQLVMPVDVHVERIARKLMLITGKTNNWHTAVELTNALKELDANDPVKYDFALFNMGVVEKY